MPGPASARWTRVAFAVGIVASLVAALLLLDGRGKAARAFARTPAALEADRPDQVLDIWRAQGVRGRTLLLFGPFPHPGRTGEARATGRPEGLVSAAAFEGVVRRVYVVVPDERWEEDFGAPRPGFYRAVPGLARGLYMRYPLGLPVVATTPSALPALAEPSLVYVDRRRFDPAAVMEYLARTRQRFDLLVTSTGL